MAKSNYSGLKNREFGRFSVAPVRGPIVFASGAVNNEASTVLEHRMKDLLNRRVLKSIKKKDLRL